MDPSKAWVSLALSPLVGARNKFLLMAVFWQMVMVEFNATGGTVNLTVLAAEEVAAVGVGVTLGAVGGNFEIEMSPINYLK